MDYGSLRQLYVTLTRIPLNLVFFFCVLVTPSSFAASNTDALLSVWANEAIVTTYTFNATNLLDHQKNIATYFTSQGWINYTKALDSAKLKDAVQKNGYSVSAVALLPPEIKPLPAKGEWQATIPVLVLYKNKQYQQKQTLQVVITFITAKPGEGVRGLAITSFNSTVITPPCQCDNKPSTKTIV